MSRHLGMPVVASLVFCLPAAARAQSGTPAVYQAYRYQITSANYGEDVRGELTLGVIFPSTGMAPRVVIWVDDETTPLSEVYVCKILGGWNQNLIGYLVTDPGTEVDLIHGGAYFDFSTLSAVRVGGYVWEIMPESP